MNFVMLTVVATSIFLAARVAWSNRRRSNRRLRNLRGCVIMRNIRYKVGSHVLLIKVAVVSVVSVIVGLLDSLSVFAWLVCGMGVRR